MTTRILPLNLSEATACGQPKSQLYRVWVNDQSVEVFHTNVADFVAFECGGTMRIAVEATQSFSEVWLRPLSRGLKPVIEGDRVHFEIDRGQNLCLDIPGQNPLFIYANPPVFNRPDANDPKVHFFKAGQIYEVGEIELKSGETLYIEAGAVVKACVRAWEADNIRICGQGILHGGAGSGKHTRFVVLERCTNVLIEDIIMIEPKSWMLILGACRGVRIRNLKQIGEVMSSDGIDICGSKDVVIEGCCLRNNDDNVVIKALHIKGSRFSWEEDVENIRVRDCVFWNAPCGNAMEIGYELRTTRVSDVVFENIDVLCVHGQGAAFSIHNGDRAVVENVRWENIRVEHHWDKLVDFRVVNSRYSKDLERGRIRNIVLKNIRAIRSHFNEGCTISLISGFDSTKPVEGIVFEDIYFNEKKITTADELDLHLRNVRDLTFR
jgi:polygalacturonase